MDDVFDKLDEQRVEQIIALVKNQDFGHDKHLLDEYDLEIY